MGRERKNAPGAASGDHAKERHKRDRKGNVIDWTAPLPPGLVARLEKPRISSKHKSWFEFIENKDKKKKLEFEFTEKREPPPGFEFVPIGNPALTTACKELSREQGAMIFIVTSSNGQFSKRLSLHLNRAGHHIRQTIVEQARASLGDDHLIAEGPAPGQPEPIPQKQEDINKQADAAIRDLFPRIPNTDRQMIIEHAFNKSRLSKGEPPVGLASHLTLSRRAQLAVLAHIRHNHTRYDQLLRETTYVNARKAVESLCLDILVKWRGDEETGRDQLDEILCEVIVISDSESDESDDDEDEDESSSSFASSGDEVPAGTPVGGAVPRRAMVPPPANSSSAPLVTDNSRIAVAPRTSHAPQKVQKTSRRDKRAAKWAQRGFSRYQAAWHQAVERQRLGNDEPRQSPANVTGERFVSREPQPWRTGEPESQNPRSAVVRSAVEPPPNERYRSDGVSFPPSNVQYERGSRVDDFQQTIPRVDYRVAQDARIYGNPSGNGGRPIVASRPPADGAPSAGTAEIERVRYYGQDLKDYLVASIEPSSPEPPSFSQRFPVPARHPESNITRDVEGPRRVVSYPRGPAGPQKDRAAAAERFHAACAEEGFVKLAPRSDPARIPIMPSSRSDPLVLRNPQPVRASRGSPLPATSAAPVPQRRPTYSENPVLRGSGLSPQPAPRPDWIAEDGVVLMSEARSIFIRDHPAPPIRELGRNSAYASSDTRRFSPNRGPGEVRRGDPVWADEREKRYAETSIDQRINTLPGEFVEIVRVSNKFPRQHEPRSTHIDSERYDVRPSTLHQRPPQLLDDGVMRYDPRRLPQPMQRVERAVERGDQPHIRGGDAHFVTRQPVTAKTGIPKQERVVGIEYVQTRPSLDGRTFSDRGPLPDPADRVYRSRSRSVIPVSYPVPGYPLHPSRSVPRADEIITLD